MLELPIDVVPGPGPLRFRWKQTIDTVIGPRSQVCEGSLTTSAELAVVALIGTAKHLQVERDKLQAFKDWVHAYLDARGVPEAPPGVHGVSGCRIGDRMDWLVEQLDAANRRVDALEVLNSDRSNTPTEANPSAVVPQGHSSRDKGRRK